MDRSKNCNGMAATETRRLTLCALGIAIGALLDGLFKVPVNLFGMYALKLTFGMVPVIYLSIRFGPLYGGLCGVLMDFLQAILFPLGAFNPLFSISAFVKGALPGLLQYGRPLRRDLLILGIAAGQTFGGIFLTTFFLVVSYGLPWQILWPRAAAQLPLIPAYVMLVHLVFKIEQRRALYPSNPRGNSPQKRSAGR